jgi:CRP-like cAMP-binding protein
VSRDAEKLSTVFLFRQIAQKDISELCRIARPVDFRPGDEVFTQGQSANCALLVVEGRLVASVGSGSEKREVGDSRAGEIVGETGLFSRTGKRSATVHAAENTRCLILDTDVLLTSPYNTALVAIEAHLLGSIARRIRGSGRVIQRVWKESGSPEGKQSAGRGNPSLRERLSGLFGGGW